jgi:hypothetical protein
VSPLEAEGRIHDWLAIEMAVRDSATSEAASYLRIGRNDFMMGLQVLYGNELA